MVIDKNLKCVKGSENSADIYLRYDKFLRDWFVSQVDLKDLKKRACHRNFCILFENRLKQDVSFKVNCLLHEKGGYYSNGFRFHSFFDVFVKYLKDFVLSGSKKNFYFNQLCLEQELYVRPFQILSKNKKVYFRAFFEDCFLKDGMLFFKFHRPVFVDEYGNLTEFVFCEENKENEENK